MTLASRISTLYLCYQGIIEPLTQTQVVPYLEGMANAGYRVVLLTFEPRQLHAAEVVEWKSRLGSKGIAWHWLRYHKSPSVPATAYDIAAGSLEAIRLARHYKVRLVHARGYVPGVMAVAVKRATGARFLFDIRGFMAEEYVDVGTWPAGGALYRTTKRMERWMVDAADGFVVLTTPARAMLTEWYPQTVRGKPLQVIPCCVDLRHVPREVALSRTQRDGASRSVVYVGKLGGWYMTEEMAAFVAQAREADPTLRWRVWTQSDSTSLREVCARFGLSGHVDIGLVAPEALLGEIVSSQAALSFIQPSLSKRASSPTKIGEYLGAGLPVISSAGIGDVDSLLLDPFDDGGAPVGVLVHAFDGDAYRDAIPPLKALMEDPDTAERCRAAAESHLDLERVGWPRYRELYRALIEG